jgi:hypothetical protein
VEYDDIFVHVFTTPQTVSAKLCDDVDDGVKERVSNECKRCSKAYRWQNRQRIGDTDKIWPTVRPN